MRCYWPLISALFLAGCMASNGLQYDSVAQTNVYRIARVNKGMSEREVLQIMKRPYSYESFDFCDDIYDVWFYVTRPTGLDQTRMVPMNLTPLTFRNGVLVGMGYDYYYFLTKEEAKKTAELNAPEIEAKKKSTDVEDKEFEKALKGPKDSSDLPIENYSKPETSEPNPLQPAKVPVKQSKKAATTPAAASFVPLGAMDESQLAMGSKSSSRFSQLKKGMTQEEVQEIVGEPLTYESFAKENDVYEVWLYSSNPSQKKDGHQALKNMVPLTFKNGSLAGMTYKYYEEVKTKSNRLDEERVNGYDKSGEDLQQDESEQDFNYW